MRPKARKRWILGVCDTALLLWDCPRSAQSRAGHTGGKETFLKSWSSFPTQQNRSDLLHFGFNTRHEWGGSALKALPDGHCWLNANLSAEIQRRKKSVTVRGRGAAHSGSQLLISPRPRAPAAQRAVPAVPTSPGTPDIPCQPPGSNSLFFIAAAHTGSGKRGTVTFCQTYCASLGFKTLQAVPSKTSPCKCIFPALCLLAEDGLLNILS